MIEATAAAVSKVVPSPPPPDDPIFDFTVTEWIVPPLLVSRNDQSSAKLRSRQQNEHVYRRRQLLPIGIAISPWADMQCLDLTSTCS